MPDNRKRIFADVVTVDAWHDGFGESAKAALHADVVFASARIGGEKDAEVRFRLSLRRAEVVVVVPEGEPVSVDKRSVSRDSPELEGTRTKTVERSKLGKVSGKLSGSVSEAKVTGAAEIGLEAEATYKGSEKLATEEVIKLMISTQSQTSDGQYRWIVEPTIRNTLEGRPWDAQQQPRLTLIDERRDPKQGIAPTVRVEIRCLREDLSIDDLEMKDDSIWSEAKRRAGFKSRMAAAEAYIRDCLAKEGLYVRNFDDRFGVLQLASVTAES